jgi:carboxymethylenebutenolidase
MTAVHGTTVDIPTPDGVADAYLAYPDDGAAHPGVLVFQDAFGLRPALRDLGDRIAAHGYCVLIPNLFYRAGRAPVLDLPEFIDLEARPEVFGQLMPLIMSLTPEVVKSDSGAYLDWMAASDKITAGPVGATGYCMGGRLVVQTAAAHPDRIAAGAGFHTGHLVLDGPGSPHRALESVTAELYFAFADNDEGMTPEHIEEFDKALAAAGIRHKTEVYEGAAHGYTQIDTSVYNEEAAERHYRELFALLDRTIGQPQG